MPTASSIRLQVESALARKIPAALTPAPKMVRPVTATGIRALDEALQGGLPVGAVSELVGPECSGRTSVALSFLAQITQAAKVCAWIDASDMFDPISAAAAGVDLDRLLWIRCGAVPASDRPATHCFSLPEKYLIAPPAKKGLHGGGHGPHPRTETKGLYQAVPGLLRPEGILPIDTAARCAEPQRREPPTRERFAPNLQRSFAPSISQPRAQRPWSRIEQALRSADLLLQGGGFSAIVLDMGGLNAEAVSRIPLATWFRYRAAAEKTQSSILLLTQHACAKSSAELVLRLEARAIGDERTVFSGIAPRVEVVRRRFAAETNVVPLRKPPRNVNAATWQSRTAWAGRR